MDSVLEFKYVVRSDDLTAGILFRVGVWMESFPFPSFLFVGYVCFENFAGLLSGCQVFAFAAHSRLQIASCRIYETAM